MSKSKKSLLTSVSALLYTLLNGLLGMIVISLTISKYGSDFNGLTASANQLVNVILVIEGGFTIATNVALFSPYIKKDWFKINQIRNATSQKFKQIGLIFLLIGLLSSFIYSFFIKTNYTYIYIFTILVLSIVPSFFNLYYSIKWKILFQMEQKEYVLNIISICTITLTHLTNIILIINNTNPLWTRVTVFIFAILNIFFIFILGKKSYKNIDNTINGDLELIKGTSDVFVQKITNALYSTLPVFYITTFLGTKITSVYIVYYNVFTLIKNLLYAFLNGPRMALGQSIKEKNKDELFELFMKYQFISFSVMTLFICMTYSLMIPFLQIYIHGNTDIDYVNYSFLFLLTLISLFETLHLPSGVLLNMAGRFKTCKNIQVTACIILLLGISIGNIFLGINGILLGVLLTAISLCIMEVYAIHEHFFKNKLKNYVIYVLKFILILIFIIYINNFCIHNIYTFMEFILLSMKIFIIDLIILVFCLFIFFTKELTSVCKILIPLLKK